MTMNESYKMTMQKTQDKNLLTVQLKRTTHGTKLYLKSSIIEDYFKQNGFNDFMFMCDGNNIRTYNVNRFINSTMDNFIKRFDFTLKTRNGYTNMSFLRAQGLSNGLTFDIEGVYSRTAITDYMNELKTHIREFYEYELKPLDMKMEFIIRENV